MELKHSEIRKIVADEHEALRKTLAQLTATVDAVQAGDAAAVARLASELDAAFTQFTKHIAHEEGLLAPVLENLDAWGDVRREAMREEHQQQRAWVERLRALDVASDVATVAAEARAFVGAILRDMAQEEKDFLNDKVLRDDIIVTDTFGG